MKEVPLDRTNSTILFAYRDPTPDDVNYSLCYWVSMEYIPYRVFVGEKGKWQFTGKFFPLGNK